MARRRIASGSSFEELIGYSRCVVDGDLVFSAGCAGYDYRTGGISGDVVEQVRQTFANLEAGLTEAGAGLADVVQIRYYLGDAGDLERVAPVLLEFMGAVRPAATTLVSRFIRPEIRFELDAIARLPGAG
ncbi:MAG: RidA family protein [Alphaproteobacteria bacterium]